MRILPHQGARHSTVDHGDASDGVFLLLHLWVLPSRRAIHLANDLLPLLSLACRRPLWRMALSLCEWRHLHVLGLKNLPVQEKGGPNRPQSGPGRSAIPTQFGRPFAPVGPHVFMHFAPPFALFWWCHHRVQDGGFPCMKFSLLRFNPRGCSFITLRSLPPLGLISSSS
jgi:hypothetical protein